MVFGQEDTVLIKNLYLSKGYSPVRLLNEFPEKGWKLGSVKTLLTTVRLTGTIELQKGSVRPRSAGTVNKVQKVEELVLSQEDKPKTHL